MPIVLPSRIDAELLECFRQNRHRITMVVHANHAREIAADCKVALQNLASTGMRLLNQSVLLQSINSELQELYDLSIALGGAGVTPYYLHLLDKVEGACHFDVEEVRARELMQELRGRLPGYLVPRLVREIPGESSKTIIV